jgi:hypothetical protein
MLNILGIERTSVDTIARSSVDFVISLVILSNRINLAIVENWPVVGKTDRIMIAKSRQFQPSKNTFAVLGKLQSAAMQPQ